MTRNEKLLFSIVPATQSGIEIGPLDKPVVTRDMGPIRYVDYLSTKELQARYADDPNVDTDRIMQVDYVLGSNTLAQAIGDMAPVDYVVASHIIEHTPDMIGWMKEIHAILRPGGVLSLAIPDKRYTFDIARSVTRSADVIEAYLHGYKKPSIRQIFDFVSSVVKVDAAQAWAGEIEENELEKLPPGEAHALQICREALANDSYFECHCWVFTPDSFIELLRKMIDFDLFNYKVVQFFDTEFNTIEFMVALEALGPTETLDDRRCLQHDSIQAFVSSASQEEGRHSEIAELSRPQLRRLVDDLSSKLGARDHELAAMRASTSWRITRPLRRLRRALSRLAAR